MQYCREVEKGVTIVRLRKVAMQAVERRKKKTIWESCGICILFCLILGERVIKVAGLMDASLTKSSMSIEWDQLVSLLLSDFRHF